MKFYLLGASNPNVIRLIDSIQKVEPDTEFVGFLDNDVDKHLGNFFGYPILGGKDIVPSLSGPSVRFVNLITRDTLTRLETTVQLVKGGGTLGNLIHPEVDLRMVNIGPGSYLQERAMLQSGASLGSNSSLSIGSFVGHESNVGDHCFFSAHSTVCGQCEIGSGVFIGANATISPRISIGHWATVGAGSVVHRDLPSYCVAVGNPARVIKYRSRDEIKRIEGFVSAYSEYGH